MLPSDELGPVGREKFDDFIPDFGLELRTWAGGKLRVERPLMLDLEACETSSIESMAEKNGRSDRLVFVTVRHKLSQSESLALFEHQGLVAEIPEARLPPNLQLKLQTPAFT